MTVLLPLLSVVAVLLATPLAAEPLELVVNGRARSYVLERPAGQGPRPTIIMLHGLGGTGADYARRSGLAQLAPRQGFAAVFPDGLRNRWNHFLPGKEPVAFLLGNPQVGVIPDDVGFFKLLVADLVRRGISDPKRIYLAGLSAGGFMTLRMICAEAGLFAAAALLVAAMPERLGAECRPGKPMPVLMINGTADPIIPYAGGKPAQPGDFFSTWSIERLVGFFGELNGCAGAGEQSVLPNPARNKVEIVRWPRCAGGPVTFYRVVGGDHGAAWEVKFGELLPEFFRDKVRDDAPGAAAPMPTPVAAPAGQPASVKAVFEKYDLFGTFSLNCSRPVGRSNQYYVHRLLDGGRVQREMKSSLTTRDFLVVFERGSELRPNEISRRRHARRPPRRIRLSRRIRCVCGSWSRHLTGARKFPVGASSTAETHRGCISAATSNRYGAT